MHWNTMHANCAGCIRSSHTSTAADLPGSTVDDRSTHAAHSPPADDRGRTCEPRNVASAAVIRKIGMRYEGRMRGTARIRDGWRDSDLYAIRVDD
jgi:hypothetical protein